MNQEVCYSLGKSVLYSGSGTPGYFPPEKLAVRSMENEDEIDIAHSLTPKSDIYSLGIVFLEIIGDMKVRTNDDAKEALIAVGKGEMKGMLKILKLMTDSEKLKRLNATLIIGALRKVWGKEGEKLEEEGRKKATTDLTSHFWELYGETEELHNESTTSLIPLDNDYLESILEYDDVLSEEQQPPLKRGRDVAQMDSTTRDRKKNKQ